MPCVHENLHVKKNSSFFFLSASLLIVSLAQPDWSIFFCILTACMGYALFWKGLFAWHKKSQRFWIATFWFAICQGFHLNWFLSNRYAGGYIPFFWGILVFVLGLQFGGLSLLISKKMDILHILGVAGIWTLVEWGRLFFLSGFSWNPLGISLVGTVYGMQLASLCGIFGLTFLVVLANLMALKLLLKPFSWHLGGVWLLLALTPYIFGFVRIQRHAQHIEAFPQSLNILLVQTALYPEQKTPFEGNAHFLSPYVQWMHILQLLQPHLDQHWDLIVLPEGALPYGTDFPIYCSKDVRQTLMHFLGRETKISPLEEERVGNGYWVQSIANIFNADVVIGLEDYEKKDSYQSALFFRPFSLTRERYEKRVLVPMAEYIPFEWCRKILSKYGIQDSYIAGKEAKVFSGKSVPFGVSICYEETFGHLMRENRLKGAALLVNLTNDAWYPQSRLPFVHYLHGKVRTVEMGLPAVRACNTGVTCGIDSLGRNIEVLEFDRPKSSCQANVLALGLPCYTYSTLYSLYGDALIIWISILCVVLFSFCFFVKKMFS